MRKKKKSAIEDKKQNTPRSAILDFLGLLNEISLSPDVLEFCTPGHKGGSGFEAMLSVKQTDLLVALSEEVR